MQSVSDDAVRKILLEKSRSELAVKGVFRLEGCYIFRQGVPGLWAMQQPGKQAWLIAWPLAPEDDFACRTKQLCHEDCVGLLARAFHLYSIRSETHNQWSEVWPARQWCGWQIAGEWAPVGGQHFVPVQSMLVGQQVQHFRSWQHKYYASE